MRALTILLLLSTTLGACNTRRGDSPNTNYTLGTGDNRVPGDSMPGDTPPGDPSSGSCSDNLDCTYLEDDCNAGICNLQTNECFAHALVETTPCGDQTETECNLANRCDGYGSCSENFAAPGTTCTGCTGGTCACAEGDCVERCGDGTIDPGGSEECDGVNAPGCPGRCQSDCTCRLRDCKDALSFDPSAADGIYNVQPTDGGADIEVYCDMTADGGGWTLLGTIAGSGSDVWAVQGGIWSDSSTVGAASDPWLDYKSAAWSSLDLNTAKALWQRRYDGSVEGQAILGNPCLGTATVFSDIFTTWNTGLSCAATDVTLISGSATGVASADHAEGGNLGLGGAGTNGLCWMGEDTDAAEGFQGHLVWADAAAADCAQASHIGGVALFSHNGTTLADTDVTGTAWLAGTDPALTAVSVYVRREADGCTGDDECIAARGEGYACDTVSGLCYQPGVCDDSDPSIAPCPAPSTCLDSALGGRTCTGCSATAGGCRAGEQCLDFGLPGLTPFCLGGLGGGLP